MKRTFHIPRISATARAILVGIIAALLALAAWFLTGVADEPIGAIIGSAVVVPVALLFARLLVRSSAMKLEVSGQDVTLHVPWYGKQMTLQDLQLDAARLVGPDEEEWQLKWRTNGIGFPGYLVGWFSTKGKHRVLAAVTTGDRVVIPTRKKFSLLVSFDDASAVLDALKQAGR